MAFDFTTLLDPRINIPGGPASEDADPAVLGFLGQLFDAIQSLAAGGGASATASRMHAVSAAQTALASTSAHAIGWTISGGEAVGADVVVDADPTKLDIVNAGVYAVTIKGIANAGSGKLIDDAKLAVAFNSLDDTVEIGASHPTAADIFEAAPSFVYFLPAAAQITATLTVVTHDASVWSIPATCSALIQRVG